MPRLNPAQHKLFQRHIDRAIEALEEADRLLKGAVGDVIARCLATIRKETSAVDQEESNLVKFELASLPVRLVPYLENPFAQGLAFNLFCQRTDQSHTQAAKTWEGGTAAVSARNLVFLPAHYEVLWQEGLLDKTRLVAIANRNLTEKAYVEVADLVRTRRREDVDERLLKLPPGFLQVGRRGPGEAMEAATKQGWIARLREVEIPGELVVEAGKGVPEAPVPAEDGSAPPPAPPAPAPVAETAADAAKRTLRAGLGGAKIDGQVADALALSPDPMVLVERYLTAHRRSGDADPAEVSKTLFFSHAGPMQRIVADDKLLLRHFRPVKTQKRGQLFYRLLEVIEEALLEKQHLPELGQRGLGEQEAQVAVRKVIIDLNKDPNRFLIVPDEWLGEVTRRHLYFGSRTRKEGAAYKWYRKIGPLFFLGAHKTKEESDAKAERRAAKVAGLGSEEE
ncbi:MAG: hypothetical protein QOJ26_129 [Thermoplasmata archaeon]|nr:hypothetical protein [Thermoplasmata archaeon]